MISRSFLLGFTEFALKETSPPSASKPKPKRPSVIGRPPKFGFWLKRRLSSADDTDRTTSEPTAGD